MITHHHISIHQPTTGQGLIGQKTHHEKHHKIHLPRYLKGMH